MRIIGCNWILWERTQSATFIVRQVTCEIMSGLAILRVFLAVFVMYSLKRNTYFHLIMGWTFWILVAIFVEIEFTWYKYIGRRCCKHARKIWSRSSYFGDSMNKYTWIYKGLFTRYDFVACDKLTTGLRHELFRVNQTYNSLTTLKSCRRPVVSLSHATKSCRVNRP